jgi:alpha-1,2-rhamnosyltransferase
MRILFEYTDVFKRPGRNVGIPRVVRNIANNLHKIENIRCIPIISGKAKIYDAQSIVSPEAHTRQIYKISRLIQRWQSYLCSVKTHRWKTGQRMFVFVLNTINRILSLLLKICDAKRKKSTLGRLPVMNIQPGDVVIWPGTLATLAGYNRLRQYKSQGARIVIIIYDLFQVTPYEYHSYLHQEFDVPPMMLIADGFMAISATVLQESRAFIREKVLSRSHTNPWIDQFYLGSELDRLTEEKEVRDVVRRPFQNRKPPYLMVGTILPHKNHVFVLDAFEYLWAQGVDVTLCIVGKNNEKSSEIIQRIKNHTEWNKRLFMLNDANDLELAYCYDHSKALIFPSFYEGFGLPLVEAMQHGLPVMASDIPIFRELGGEFVAFFELSNPANLRDLIREYEESTFFPAAKPVDQWQWITWLESTRQLVERVVEHEMVSE